jgi:hypothetical protein
VLALIARQVSASPTAVARHHWIAGHGVTAHPGEDGAFRLCTAAGTLLITDRSGLHVEGVPETPIRIDDARTRRRLEQISGRRAEDYVADLLTAAGRGSPRGARPDEQPTCVERDGKLILSALVDDPTWRRAELRLALSGGIVTIEQIEPAP